MLKKEDNPRVKDFNFKFQEESTKKLKQYIDENNTLMNEITNLKDKNSSNELEISRLKEV